MTDFIDDRDLAAAGAPPEGERWLGVDLGGPLDVCVVVEGRRMPDGQVRVHRALDVRFGGAAAPHAHAHQERRRAHLRRLAAAGVTLKVIAR